MHAGYARRFMHLLLAHARVYHAYVFHYGAGIEERLLQHYAYVFPQMAVLNVVYVHAVYVYFARGAGVKPLQKLHKAGFAAAGGAEYGYCFAGVGCE